MKLQIWGPFLAACSTLFVISTHAALGDQLVTSSSANSTSNSRQATSVTASGSTYSVSESTIDGVAIRQFVNSQGRVFGISWKGVDLPPLDTLLGIYLPEYKSAVKARGRQFGRRTLKISTDNIVVEGSSRQTDQRGRAYIPASLPLGFDLKEINFNE
ncbi:DUF2844 domain-containing protein [Bdellovibrio sp. SKB1291214]|uniref:DUF2844 domain-containing protein n=1 Tax=Bdellovibrio sp. SKB1291214 TaxID=1732569 RepID=UPI000B519466|nr:DUF2844 domain-containing protein [Bdellovibrio sp. SKB1291214]UYL08407.1 DUF2844 domain-containing protein [Bdellovibrio sp. SKB1291214]